MKAIIIAITLAATPVFAAAQYTAVPLEGFDDAVKHWNDQKGSGYARHDDTDIIAIAENILIMQRDHGGWIENQDPARVLSDEDKAAYIAAKSDARGSFDNRNVYTQIEYLMGVYEQTHDEKYRTAALRGLDYTLAMQFPACGGWPHTVPGGRYRSLLTFADDVMSGNLNLLRKIAKGQTPFASFDDATRDRAAKALKRGDECLLRLQVRQNGVLSGWAGQYDPVTLLPHDGRTFELASVVSQETVGVLEYLMNLEDPTPDQVAAVDAAIDWLKRSEIHGYRLEKVKLAEPVRYQYHTATTDYQLVADPEAPPLWARFYDLEDNSIILANRDGKRVTKYEDIHPERRSGYAWYGNWAAGVLKAYPKWKAKHP